jgi:hypothetical protein
MTAGEIGGYVVSLHVGHERERSSLRFTVEVPQRPQYW